MAKETPLDPARALSRRLNNSVLLKREDCQPVFSFKLRGAYNKMAHLSPEGAQLHLGLEGRAAPVARRARHRPARRRARRRGGRRDGTGVAALEDCPARLTHGGAAHSVCSLSPSGRDAMGAATRG